MSSKLKINQIVTKMPEPMKASDMIFDLQANNWWLDLSDVHLPYHDVLVVNLAIKEAISRKVEGVLLNGDIMDCHELSRFDKSPDDPRYMDEVKMGRDFLSYLRYKLPKARIVWKDGNHEERLQHYLMSRAPALFGLDVLTMPVLLKFADYGVEYVTDKRVIKMGPLNVVHGHEYRPGIQAPVNPARGLFLRAKSVAICGHFHQTSEHHEPTITGKPLGAWSTGCACQLNPLYMPLNKWNHGFAMIHVQDREMFSVQNFRILEGKVV